MRLNMSGGLYGIMTDHICSWLRSANREALPDPSQWEMVVGLIQAEFCEGHLTKDCAWKTTVLISKGNGDFCGMRLVKLLCKTVTGILNCRLAATIQIKYTLHGFCMGTCIGTASLKAKLLQQIKNMREEVLYEIFLDLHKTYDTLKRDFCFEVLAAY